MDILTVFYIILLLSASVLCIALVIYLKQITKSVKEISNDMQELTGQIKPLIISTTELSDKLGSVADQAKNQLNVTKEMVNNIKEHVDAVLSIEEKIRGGIEKPVLSLINNLSAVVNGIEAFWHKYKKSE